FIMLHKLPIYIIYPYTTLFRSMYNLRFIDLMNNRENSHRKHAVILKRGSSINGVRSRSYSTNRGKIYSSSRNSSLVRENFSKERSEEHTSELQSREKLVCRLMH